MTKGKAINIKPIDALGFQDAIIQGLLPSECAPQEEWLDGFTALYERAVELENTCEDQAWQAAIKAALDSASMQEIRQHTIFDSALAAIGTNSIVPELQKAAEKYRERMQQAEEQGDEQALKKAQASLQQQILAAAAAAKEAIDEAEQALAFAREAGQDPAQFLRFTLSLNERVKRMVLQTARWYGRLQNEWNAKRAERVKAAVTPKGVALGADLSQLLPQEVALLQFAPALFGKKLIERQLMLYDVEKAATSKERGDAVLLLDESASMSGDAIAAAKAYAWLLRQQMAQEGRKCHIISFSTSTAHLPADASQEEESAWLASFMGGGTDFNLPFKEAIQVAHEQALRKPDIVAITDGYANLNDDVRDAILALKREHGARLFVLHVDSERSTLSDIADIQAKIDSSALEMIL